MKSNLGLSSWSVNSRRRLPHFPRVMRQPENAGGRNAPGPDQISTGKARRACKPDSVQGVAPSGWPFLWTRSCLRASSCQPGCLGAKPAPGVAPAASLFGIAPGGACRAAPVASRAVGSYPTVSPLRPKRNAVCFLWRCPSDRSARALPGTVASGSPDFPRTVARPRPSSPPRLCQLRPSAARFKPRSASPSRP